MQLLKEMYARKGIHNGSSVRIENSVTRDNCSAALSKPRGAEVTLVTEFSIHTLQPLKIITVLNEWNSLEGP